MPILAFCPEFARNEQACKQWIRCFSSEVELVDNVQAHFLEVFYPLLRPAAEHEVDLPGVVDDIRSQLLSCKVMCLSLCLKRQSLWCPPPETFHFPDKISCGGFMMSCNSLNVQCNISVCTCTGAGTLGHGRHW